VIPTPICFIHKTEMFRLRGKLGNDGSCHSAGADLTGAVQSPLLTTFFDKSMASEEAGMCKGLQI
jgi:hypothetical protein